jgi:inositol-1,3,4-trisphosphate 5/6-kinase / inositol-tetrakisphosphate 1-kinase
MCSFGPPIVALQSVFILTIAHLHSFLYLDIPLEEQHGGKIDVILHKLTEDILCIAQISSMAPAIPRALSPRDTSPQQLAMQRIQRLLDYHDRMGASLVDHPTAVQTVMSRADMAHTLQSCLQNVRTRSGLSVGAPAFAVMMDPTDESWQHVAFPMMVKPLTAAGTKASHALTVLLNAPDDDGDAHTVQAILQEKAPCLCQEYCNHDGILYKVYVLGDFISVHARRSLPNLPARRSAYTHLDFDSQCPYPHLADFGYFEEEKKEDRIETSPDYYVSVEEVRPIVAALKQAFGLELFGFDILIATTQEPRTLRVVDVNYFPSYKEVTQFPMLLAQYLTQRAQVGPTVA